jgi:hypothetical protein
MAAGVDPPANPLTEALKTLVGYTNDPIYREAHERAVRRENPDDYLTEETPLKQEHLEKWVKFSAGEKLDLEEIQFELSEQDLLATGLTHDVATARVYQAYTALAVALASAGKGGTVKKDLNIMRPKPTLATLIKYKGQLDKRQPSAFLKEVRDYISWDLADEATGADMHKHISQMVRNNLEANVQNTVQIAWDQWAVGHPGQWPEPSLLQKWIESTRTETYDASSILNDWEQVEQATEGVNAFNAYANEFRRVLNRLLEESEETHPTIFIIKHTFFKHMHKETQKIAAKYGENEHIKDNDVSFEDYVALIRHKLTSLKTKLSTPAEKSFPYTRKGGGKGGKGYQKRVVTYDHGGNQAAKRVVTLVGGGKGGGRPAKRANTASVQDTIKRCPHCLHPGHTDIAHCWYHPACKDIKPPWFKMRTGADFESTKAANMKRQPRDATSKGGKGASRKG